jgi:hypothetical protein
MVLDPNRKRLGFFYVYRLLSRASSCSSTLSRAWMPPGVRRMCPVFAQSATASPWCCNQEKNTSAGRAWVYRAKREVLAWLS